MDIERLIDHMCRQRELIEEALQKARPSKAAEELHAKQNRLNICINALLRLTR